MTESMTIDEIRSLYDHHWILIGNPVSDENDALVSGCVLFASPNRDDVYQRAAEPSTPKYIAIDYTGPMPECLVLYS